MLVLDPSLKIPEIEDVVVDGGRGSGGLRWECSAGGAGSGVRAKGFVSTAYSCVSSVFPFPSVVTTLGCEETPSCRS